MIVKTIGRGQDNDIVIRNDGVSRIHLQLIQDEYDNISVVDLGSTNGTFVNGKQISTETRLKPGDTLRAGDSVIPWETYFYNGYRSDMKSSESMDEKNVSPQHSKRKTICFFVAGFVVLFILIVVGVISYVNNKNNFERELIAQEERNRQLNELRDQDYLELKDRERKAELDAKAEKEKRAEEGRRHVAEKQLAEKKADEQAKKVVNDLKNEKSSVESERDSARRESASVKKERDSAKEEAKQANAKAEENKKIAQEQAETTKLTEEFYKELNKANNEKRLKEVCSALGIEKAKSEERYDKIENLFKIAKDNQSRRRIINTIKNTQKKSLFGKSQDNPQEEIGKTENAK